MPASNVKPSVQVGSLDLFWMPELVRALEFFAECELLSTWSFKRRRSPASHAKNAWLLHYTLALYKRFPILQCHNSSYLALCKVFDHWLAENLRENFDVLYFLSGCGLSAMHKAHKWGMKVVIESGSTHTDFQHRIVWEEYRRNGLKAPLFPEEYRRRVRQEFLMGDFIQIPSEFVRSTYLAEGISEEKLLKAPYGVDVGNFVAKRKHDVSETFRVICPSGVNLRKGARVLVEAWRKLGWKPAEAELHWIGWPNHPEVRHLFKPPLPGVIWHGWMPHEKLAALLRSNDALVLPSFEEGLARVLIEAAASGLALIATPNTGVEDFFTPGAPEGWLIPCNDVDALCAALEEARADRQRTFLLGQRAAERSRHGYSWEDYGRRVTENFVKVLNA